jgi:hypothetical protein
MSRKHYVGIAAAFNEVLSEPDLDTATRDSVLTLVTKFADLFSADNPRFKRAKFGEACASTRGGN